MLVVGAGPAGAACADTLRDLGHDGSILMLGRELEPPYERPPCSKGYLQGTMSRDECLLQPEGHWAGRDIELAPRVSAMKADLATRTVNLSVGGEVAYRQALVLATGAMVRRLRVDGGQLEGIHYLRALANADAIRADAGDASSIVLVGGSYIACEVAATLTELGKRCTLVMLEDAPLTTGFGPRVGEWAAELLRARGVELVCGDGLDHFEGGERVERVVTAAGRSIDADLVVMGTGATPDVMFARAAGLELGETGGVACSSRLEAADGVWAAGDVCEYDSVLHGRRLRIEHWELALAQGRCVARNVMGAGEDFAEVPYFWSDLADWATIESVGPAESWDAEVVRGTFEDAWTVFYGAEGKLVAAVTCGRSEDLDEARELIASGGPLPQA